MTEASRILDVERARTERAGPRPGPSAGTPLGAVRPNQQGDDFEELAV